MNDRDAPHLGAGAVAGLIAGTVMLLFMMEIHWQNGLGLFLFPKLIAATFFGIGALLRGPGAAVAGWVAHFAFSVVFGVIFAFLVSPHARGGKAFVGGLAFGIAVWALMSYIVLPAIDPTMAPRMELMQSAWFVSHLIFGGILGLTPSLGRAFGSLRVEKARRAEARVEQKRAA